MLSFQARCRVLNFRGATSTVSITLTRSDDPSAHGRGNSILELNGEGRRDVVGFIDEGPMSTCLRFVNEEGDWEGHVAMSHLQFNSLSVVRCVLLLSAVVHVDESLSVTNG